MSGEKTSVNELLSAMEQSQLFSGFPEAAELADIRSFESGQTVFDCSGGEKALGLAVSGRLTVLRQDGKSEVVLNSIEKGGCFGASTLFSAGVSGAATRVVAANACVVAFFSQTAVSGLITGNGAFALSYVSFLSDRVRFLNSRITDFTGGSAVGRLAGELLRSGEDVFEVSSFAGLSRKLDVGRASLYRALDELSGTGAIRRDGKTIIISDRDALSVAK